MALQAYKVATLNINNVQSSQNLQLIKDWLYTVEIDICLLQEVSRIPLEEIHGYNVVGNSGALADRGTAILCKEGIILTEVTLLEDGRGVAATLNDMRIVNIYAPSGSSQRVRRAEFFKTAILPLFQAHYSSVLLAGDFNCVLHPKDQTPNASTSLELQQLISDLALLDTWEHQFGQRRGYTHITSHSASRIDRIYISNSCKAHILNAEIWPTVFSDHAAYICTLNLPRQATHRSWGIWKFNISHLRDIACQQRFLDTWNKCRRRRLQYDNVLHWWILYAKPQLRRCLMTYSREKAWWMRQTTDFYFQCLRELYADPDSVINNYTRIKRIQAKIRLIRKQQVDGLKVRARTTVAPADEDPSVYHLVQERKRINSKIVTRLRLPDGRIVNTQEDIIRAFQECYTSLMSTEIVDPQQQQEFLQQLTRTLTDEQADSLMEPIDEEELQNIIFHSPKNKSPGADGLPIEVYQTFWEHMKTEMVQLCNALLDPEVRIPPGFTDGVVVFIPKTSGAMTFGNFRPLTLLNTDYKSFARVITQRLRGIMNSIISEHQTSVGRDRTIFHGILDYRDVVAVTETCRSNCAIISIDLDRAFDRVDHQFLYLIMRRMGFSPRFVDVIARMIGGTVSRLMINGRLSDAIHLRRSIRQGCPLSMNLFAIAIEPLLASLSTTLQGLVIRDVKITCRAYADDVGCVVNSTEEVDLTLQIAHRFSMASGARINLEKSGVFQCGAGLSGYGPLPLRVMDNFKCLGIKLWPSIHRTVADNYRTLLCKLRGSVRSHLLRNLDDIQKTRLANMYFVSKLNYVAHVLPLPSGMARSFQAMLGYFVSRNKIFKVRYSTLTLPIARGGLNLINVYFKARAMFLSTVYQRWRTTKPTLTRYLLNEFMPQDPRPPIAVGHVPYALHHLRTVLIEDSYLRLQLTVKQMKKVRSLYTCLLAAVPANIVERKFPRRNWPVIWQNVHAHHLPTRVKAAWYNVVNRKTPTAERMHNIHLAPTPLCQRCGRTDDDHHRFECDQHTDIWRFVRSRLALINRSIPERFGPETFLLPDERPFPAAKRNATNWLKGHMIYFLFTNEDQTLSMFYLYLMDQLRQLRHKATYQRDFANFLEYTIPMATPP